MTQTLAVQPQHLDYYNYFVMCNYVFNAPEPVIENAYTYEENGVLYCASATQKGVYRYTYARNNPLMYTDPDGEFIQFITIPLIAGMANWTFNGFQYNLQGLGYFGIGMLSGLVSAGVGTLMASAVGTLGFISGAITAGTAGFTGGFISGAGNSWMQGNSFGQGLMGGLKTGGVSALTAGLMGGINGACEAYVRGGNIWTGAGIVSESIATEQIVGNQVTEGFGLKYSNDDAKNFSNKHYGENVKGVSNLYADGSTPEGHAYYKDGDLVYNSNNNRVKGLSVTKRFGKSDVYLFKEAFVSKQQLYLTMGHEYGHAFYNTLPFTLESNNEHTNIYRWQYEQAKLFNYNVNYYYQRYESTMKIYRYTYFPFEPRIVIF